MTHVSLTRGLAVTVLAVLVGLLSPAIHAQQTPVTYYEADASLNAWTNAFLMQNGNNVFFTTGMKSVNPKEVGGYGEALDIAVLMDAYERTKDPNQLQVLINEIETFKNFTGSSWASDSWNDDIGWMVNVYVRAYKITNNPVYLTIAENNWNAAYNKGWSTDLGGGIWENDSKGGKECLSNDPFIWEGVELYKDTGDETYLTKAEAIYAWVKANLFNATDTANAVGAPGQLVEGMNADGTLQTGDNLYNSGSFLVAADSLFQITGDKQYYDDAILDINHVINNQTIVANDSEGSGNQWAYFFMKGLSLFAAHNNLWSTYYPWMLANADAAWAQRDSNNLTWNNWTKATDANNPPTDAVEMSSAVGIWQVLLVPQESQIVNDDAGLAIDVYPANESNNAQLYMETAATATSAEQQWMVIPTPDGHQAIISALTGMAMGIAGGSTDDGAAAVDEVYTLGDTSQEFDLVASNQGSPWYLLQNVKSGKNVEENGWHQTPGTVVNQWGWAGSGQDDANQSWKLIDVPPGTPQTINFPNPGAQTVGASASLVATASSGLTVNFESQTPTVCTVAGTQASFIVVGTCTIQATQAGNGTYSAATPVTQNLAVVANALTSQSISFPNPGPQVVGTPLSLTATATSGLAVSFTSLTPNVCSVSGVQASLLTVGVCTIQATQSGDNSTYSAAAPVTQSFAVSNPSNPAPTISGFAPAYTSAGGAAFSLTVNGSGFVSGSTIYWGSTPLVTMYVSSSQLSANVPTSLIAQTGVSSITVQTPAPGGGTSNSMQFEVDSGGIGVAVQPTITTAPVTVTAGGAANYSVTLPAGVSYAGVACLNLPANTTCSYANKILTITTATQTPAGTYQVTVVFFETVANTTTAAALFPLLLLPLFFARKRMAAKGRFYAGCLCILLLGSVVLAVGCERNSSTPVPAQTTTISTSTTVNLIVQ